MTPRVAATVAEVRQAVGEARGRGLAVGLVPTMGALHAGHASLIRRARAETGFVVVSIFVNPTQFGPQEDLSRYPRPLDADVRVCGEEGADLAFVPAVAEVYPPRFQTYVEVTELQKGLCGASRPGHFRGVATVVLKLFNTVTPDTAYFGRKDYQQVRLIRQMVRDLDVPVRVETCPTVLEPDGLALSSRNQYLDPDQRRRATVLYQALEAARAAIEAGERDAGRVRSGLAGRIGATPDVRLDYAAVVDADTLEPVDPLRGDVLLAVAARLGPTRLIDNVVVQVDGPPSEPPSR
jgi:pantoate--beta-alanine ligase